MASLQGEAEGQALTSSLWWPVIKLNWMSWSCDRFRLNIRKMFLFKKVFRRWNIYPNGVVMASRCQSTRSVWTTLLDIQSDFWVVLCGARERTQQWLWVHSNVGYPIILQIHMYKKSPVDNLPHFLQHIIREKNIYSLTKMMWR